MNANPVAASEPRVSEDYVREIVSWLNRLLLTDKIGIMRLFDRNTKVLARLAHSGLVDVDEIPGVDGRIDFSLNMVQILNGAFGYETGTQGSIVLIRDQSTGEIKNFAQVRDGTIQA
jgi:hypothetical protein